MFREKEFQEEEIGAREDHEDLLLSLKLRPPEASLGLVKRESQRSSSANDSQKGLKDFGRHDDSGVQNSDKYSEGEYVDISEDEEEEDEHLRDHQNYENPAQDLKDSIEEGQKTDFEGLEDEANSRQNNYELVIPLKDSQAPEEKEIQSLQLKVLPSKKSENEIQEGASSSDEEEEGWSDSNRHKVRRIFVKGKAEWASKSKAKSRERFPNPESGMDKFPQKASKSSLHWIAQQSGT